jgi:hypothetical protein
MSANLGTAPPGGSAGPLPVPGEKKSRKRKNPLHAGALNPASLLPSPRSLAAPKAPVLLGGPLAPSAQPSPLAAAALAELEELREWRRRSEARDKWMNSVCSTNSSCIVCFCSRPDLISYGACGHMVCVGCALEHVLSRLMVLRRPPLTNTNGCKLRLCQFALNGEDREYSCPMCRQGQLDLMGTGLSLLPDFAYHQLALYCETQRRQPRGDPQAAATLPPGPLAGAPPSAANAHPFALAGSAQPRAQIPGQLLVPPLPALEAAPPREEDPAARHGEPDGLLDRRAEMLARFARDRAAALRALERQEAQPPASSESGPVSIACPFCGLSSLAPGGGPGPDQSRPASTSRAEGKHPTPDAAAAGQREHAAEAARRALPPSEVLRHIWRCRRRAFRCGFPDCRRPFGWEAAYDVHAPLSAGSSGDAQTEARWLALVNRAFVEHMRTDCITRATCCQGWCPSSLLSAESSPEDSTFPLHRFEEHDRIHRLLTRRFELITALPALVGQVHSALVALMHHEFRLLWDPQRYAPRGAARAPPPRPPTPPLPHPSVPLLLPPPDVPGAPGRAAPTGAAVETSRSLAAEAATATAAGRAAPGLGVSLRGPPADSASGPGAGGGAGGGATPLVVAAGRPKIDIMLVGDPLAREAQGTLAALLEVLRSYHPAYSLDEEQEMSELLQAPPCSLHPDGGAAHGGPRRGDPGAAAGPASQGPAGGAHDPQGAGRLRVVLRQPRGARAGASPRERSRGDDPPLTDAQLRRLARDMASELVTTSSGDEASSDEDASSEEEWLPDAE